MTKLLWRSVAVAAVLCGPAQAQKRVDNERGSTKNVELPKCEKSLGSVALVDGEGQGWSYYNLGAPSVLLMAFVQ